MKEKLKNGSWSPGPLTALIILVVVCGSFSSVAKLSMQQGVGPWGLAEVRAIIGIIVLLVAQYVIYKKVSYRACFKFAPISALWATNMAFFTLAIHYTSPTTIHLIHIGVPVLVAYITWLLLGQKMTKKQINGSMIAGFGVMLVILSKGGVNLGEAAFLGNTCAIIAAIAYSTYIVKSHQESFKVLTPLEMILTGSAVGALLFLPFAIVENSKDPWITSISSWTWGLVVLASLLVLLYHTSIQILVKKYGPNYAMLNQYILPVSVVIWAYLLLGDVVTFIMIIGAILAFTGVSIASKKAGT